MSTQFCPQLTHGSIPTLEAGGAMPHLIATLLQHLAVPVRRCQLLRRLGQFGPEEFHGVELVGQAHLSQGEINSHPE
jgi:hypothetical protein